MGGGQYSDRDYDHRSATRSATGRSAFGYTQDVREGRAEMLIHPLMDPNGVTRESRDSAEHPNSKAIAIAFDQTGSMRQLPVLFQAKLKTLMALLLQKGVVVDPQLLFAAVGDYYSDRVKQVQVGQFESDIRMDDAFDRMILEGGGGGSGEESYLQFLYFLAYHTSCDCYEKRGQPGYAFMTGDEIAYGTNTNGQHTRRARCPALGRDEIRRVFGDEVDHDFTIEEIVAAVQEKWHVFFIIPVRGSHGGKDPAVRLFWEKTLGTEHVIMMQNNEAICEEIAARIAALEGTVTQEIHAAVQAVGIDPTFLAGMDRLEV